MAYQVDEDTKLNFDQVLKECKGMNCVDFRVKMSQFPCKAELKVESNMEIKDLIQEIKVEMELKLEHNWEENTGEATVGLYKKDGIRENVQAVCELELRSGENGKTCGEVKIAGISHECVEAIRDGIDALNVRSLKDLSL